MTAAGAPDALNDFLTRARAHVDEALDRYLPTPPACPPLVSDAMRYSVFAGGKRLRPMLTLAAADAVVAPKPHHRTPRSSSHFRPRARSSSSTPTR